jgi:hypothetical protein
LVETKYAQEEAVINSKLTQIKALDKNILTPQQMKLKDSQTALLEKQKQDLADKKANEKDVSKLLVDASQVAPADVLQRAKDIQAKGGSATEVAMALGPYGGDYLKNKLLEEQIKTQKSSQMTDAAQRAKLYQETSDLKNAGQGGIPSKPLTEGQAKDFTYAQRGDQSKSKIETLENSIITMNPASFRGQMALASSPLTSGNVSAEIRQYNQAVQNFITANLRRESGATIAPSEFKDAYAIYIPFPGDDPTTLQAKKQARDTAVASFKGNIPGYEARVASQATGNEKYVDGIIIPSVSNVEQQTSPKNLYTSRLLGLPGVKP